MRNKFFYNRNNSCNDIKKKQNPFYQFYNSSLIQDNKKMPSIIFKKSSSQLYNKLSYLNENYKQYSLADIDDKKTNSKGPTIPIVYKRLSDEEFQKLFGILKKNKVKKNIKIKEDKTEEDNNINKSNYNNDNMNNNVNSNIKSGKNLYRHYSEHDIKNKRNKYINLNINRSCIDNSNDNKNNQIIHDDNGNQTTNNTPRKFKGIFNKIEQNNNNLLNNNISSTCIADPYLPKGFNEHKFYLTNLNRFQEFQAKKSPFYAKFPKPSLKEIKLKSNASDPFFIKPITNKEIAYRYMKLKEKKNFNPISTTNDYFSSDIFSLKKYNPEKEIKESGMPASSIEKFSITKESNSKWEIKSTIPNLFNHSSIEFNILNPGIKNFQDTKQKVYEKCENMKKISNLKKNNESSNEPGKEPINFINPVFKQKGLSEFFDMTRGGAVNLSNYYKDLINKNPNCFKKTKGICGTYGDLYLGYKNLIDRPFGTHDKILK